MSETFPTETPPIAEPEARDVHYAESYEDDYEDEREADNDEGIVSYRAIAALTPADLDRQVNELLDEGWQPHGALAVLPDGQMIQPMVIIG